MTKAVVFFFVFSVISLLGLVLLFSAVSSGMAEYGILWKTEIPEQAEQRLNYGVFPDIEQRTLATYEETGVSSREAYLQRHITPKKAPLRAYSQVTDAFCIKRNGLQGRVFSADEVENGYGWGCEPFTDIHGKKSGYLLCCNPFTRIETLAWWRYK